MCLTKGEIGRSYITVALKDQHMSRIKLATWNIHGLSNKLQDDDVNTIINKFDFIALVETWTSLRSNTKSLDTAPYSNTDTRKRLKGAQVVALYYSIKHHTNMQFSAYPVNTKIY
jgi:endonuclease/exonuclease/phosphatase family metal-dependent hydrolase